MTKGINIWAKVQLKLQGKLFLVSLVLLLLPWLGVRYIQAVEDLLQQQQAQAMATVAKASAVLVSQSPEILLKRLSILEDEKIADSTVVINMSNKVQINGYHDDWLAHYSLLKTFPVVNKLAPRQKVDPQDLSVRYLIAQQEQSLAIFLDVVDDSLHFRDPYTYKRHDADAIIIAAVDAQQRVHRYILSSSSFGSLNAYEYIGNYLDPIIVRRDTGIKAAWQKSPFGYRVELTIPLIMASSSFALSVIDVDQDGKTSTILGLADVRDADLFSTLLLPSKTLSHLMSPMATEDVRLWLVDNNVQVFAEAGQGEVVMDEPRLHSLLDVFYQLFLKQAVSDDESLSHEQALLSSDAVISALKGEAQTERHKVQGENVMIMATHPVIVNGVIVGAIIAERNTNAILGLQNKAVITLLNMTLWVFALVVVVLIGFASRLSFRIRRLNRDVSSIVNGDGRLTKQFSQRIEYDELGELRQGFEQLFERLGRYTHYLEVLASRLAHELRTPIAIIRTSLEHLEQLPEDKQIYIERALKGSERLNSIVARMSEASRLEETVNNVDLIKFDLQALLTNLLPIYGDLYPNVVFELDTDNEPLIITGSEDLIVQMLDKLLGNAVDFHRLNSPIVLELHHVKDVCALTVKNIGEYLPEGMEQQLFQPMVSIRQSMNQSDDPHLGLGLYIVKLIVDSHGGKVYATNWQQGVKFCVELPITTS